MDTDMDTEPDLGARPSSLGMARWIPWCAACAWMALARALLRGAADGYAAAGLGDVALRSLSRDVVTGLTLALPAGLVLAALGVGLGAGRRPAGRRVWTVAAVVLGTLFMAGYLPASRAHAPPLDTPAGLALHGLVVLVAILLLRWLSPGRRPSGLIPRALVPVGLGAAALACLPSALPATVGGGESASWPGRPHVLVLSLDTVRADHLGCYGYPRDTTPRLDAFAADAVRFTQAIAPEPWTLTSHMSLMTGLTPSEHGVTEGRPLAPTVPTLAERMAAAGYVTAAVVDTVPWMDARFGFDRGFHLYRRVHGGAAAKRAVAKSWLDDVGDRPLFLFVHVFDAHSDWRRAPYEAEAADRERLAPGVSFACDERHGCASEWLQAVNAEGLSLTAEQRAGLVALYDAGLAGLDREVGRLLEEVEARGRRDNTVVVVLADHGEEFMEHGQVLHEQLYDECVTVPLLVRTPETRGGVAPELVGLTDVARTLAELCGLEPPTDWGPSFADALGADRDVGGKGAEEREGLLLVQDQDVVGWRTTRWKLIRSEGGVELYDLREDPGETRDVAAERPAERAALEAALERRLDRARQVARSLGTSAGDEGDVPDEMFLDDEERERLRALGYLGGGEAGDADGRR